MQWGDISRSKAGECERIVDYILTFPIGVVIDRLLASTLTTIFSLVFTVLFGFANIIVGKAESRNKIEKKVVEETFVSIISSTLLSLGATICSVIITQVESEAVLRILSAVIISLSIIIVMFMLMITKRIFKTLDKE